MIQRVAIRGFADSIEHDMEFCRCAILELSDGVSSNTNQTSEVLVQDDPGSQIP